MPFSITPDPAFLYMSSRHQEALGHLLFGTGQYGGFVQLTGEVGTGKTTIVRALLSQQLPDVDVAFIHNPRQNENEFLQSICDELGVTYDAREVTLKQLVDRLNEHLLRAHAAGRRTVLIIDEAQNLKPSVLEQVRLLTNLETPKEKLLRIMLVGQPELSQLLARPDLRQLSSRISARYHLMPLSPQETREYIHHRLKIAGAKTAIFTPKALDLIQRYSKGIPRQINILCDRALLGAYAAQSYVVTPGILRKATREAMGELPHVFDPHARVRWRAIEIGWLIALTACSVVFVATFWPSSSPEPATAAPDKTVAPQQHSQSAEPVAEQVAEEPQVPEQDTVELLPADNEPSTTSESSLAITQLRTLPVSAVSELRRSAQPLSVVMASLLKLWSPLPIRQFDLDLCGSLSAQGLECFRDFGDWEELYQVDRPAVIALSFNGEQRYFLLQSLGRQYAIMDTAEGPKRVPISELGNLWTGEYLLLWRRETYKTTLYEGDQGSDVQWLQQRLNDLGYLPDDQIADDRYSPELDAAVRKFQADRGLSADGVVGTRTLIELGDDVDDTPHLASGLV